MSQSFLDLGVPARMAEALAAAGIAEPFPVQAITLPDALAGRDLCGRAPTGSGKTLGFAIPMMARVSQAEPHRPTGLVLVPTRELADQVQRAFVPLGRASWRFVQAIYGGAPMSVQIHSLRKGASVIVATPGRLLDIIDQGYCDLSAIEVLVIDEADRMADLGFMPDVRTIVDMTPATRQTMLWSATLDGDVNELIKDYLRDPVRHDLVGEIDFGTVDHRFVVTHPMDRVEATVNLINATGPAVVFVKTRFGVDDVTAALMNSGVTAGSLHGARTQQARQRTLDDFRRGKIQALVATDVAARGIHVDNVDLVVHYDLPDNDKDYLHRSGRTGRAGKDGTVIALVPPSRQRIAKRLIETLEAKVTWDQGSAPADRGDRDRNDRGPRPDRHARPDDRGRTAGAGPSRGFERSGRPAHDRPRDGERTRTYADRNGSDRAGSDRAGTGRPYADRNGSDRAGASRPYADRNAPRSSAGRNPGAARGGNQVASRQRAR